ncbi:hypothetical protein ACIBSV_09945 [Embleya sp. NPDC050154]|uniref:hypothetical protein n=1 Tax=unclassified Embleya TaxID=2699296 RepID=UPI0037950855
MAVRTVQRTPPAGNAAVLPTTPSPTPGTAPTPRSLAERTAAEPGVTGIPVTTTPARSRTASATTTSTGTRASAEEAKPKPLPTPDLEDLARRLVEPLSRLLRADLRRGRERAGRPYDNRR